MNCYCVIAEIKSHILQLDKENRVRNVISLGHVTMRFTKCLTSFWREGADVGVVNLVVEPLGNNRNFPHAVWVLELPVTICQIHDATAC